MAPLLGIDYGLRRIGLAVSDPDRTIAFAIGTHSLEQDGPFFPYLDDLIAERQISGIVLGLPLTADGREAVMAERVRDFARKLTEHTGLPVTLVDERYSSREAVGQLRAARRSTRDKRVVDAAAARIILQSHLDAAGRMTEEPPPASES
jgi:putative Holliday junction resolvase